MNELVHFCWRSLPRRFLSCSTIRSVYMFGASETMSRFVTVILLMCHTSSHSNSAGHVNNSDLNLYSCQDYLLVMCFSWLACQKLCHQLHNSHLLLLFLGVSFPRYFECFTFAACSAHQCVCLTAAYPECSRHYPACGRQDSPRNGNERMQLIESKLKRGGKWKRQQERKIKILKEGKKMRTKN